MRKIRLGRTNLNVTKNSFGALPIQRLTVEGAGEILKKAYESGVTFFDTARSYSDSEEKIGAALSDVRDKIVIATKTAGASVQMIEEHIATSLKNLRTDYVDIYQFHNPDKVPGADSDVYKKMVELKEKGLIRFIGITAHKLTNAIEAIESGLYDTVQYPLSCISSPEEFDMVRLAQSRDIGVIAMKAMCGGLLTSSAPSMAVLDQFDNVTPIWGVQRLSELEEIVTLDAAPPVLDEKMREYIAGEREALAGDFCRGCGYCLPCPAQINIPMMARMTLLLGRSPVAGHISEGGQEAMMRIESCTECRACVSRCPYGLDTPNLLKRNLEDYKAFLAKNAASN